MKPNLTLFIALLLEPLAAVPAAELPFPDGIQHVRVERSDSDQYKFLHDPAIEVHKGALFAAWYNCPKKEIVAESLIRCRRSKDGGKTWGVPEVVASDTSGDGTYYVPAQLLFHGSHLGNAAARSHTRSVAAKRRSSAVSATPRPLANSRPCS